MINKKSLDIEIGAEAIWRSCHVAYAGGDPGGFKDWPEHEKEYYRNQARWCILATICPDYERHMPAIDNMRIPYIDRIAAQDRWVAEELENLVKQQNAHQENQTCGR